MKKIINLILTFVLISCNGSVHRSEEVSNENVVNRDDKGLREVYISPEQCNESKSEQFIIHYDKNCDVLEKYGDPVIEHIDYCDYYELNSYVVKSGEWHSETCYSYEIHKATSFSPCAKCVTQNEVNKELGIYKKQFETRTFDGKKILVVKGSPQIPNNVVWVESLNGYCTNNNVNRNVHVYL